MRRALWLCAGPCIKIGEVSLLTNDVAGTANFYKKLLGMDNGSDDAVYQKQRWGDGEMPESEMSRIELFDSVPENYTYDSAEEARDLERIKNMPCTLWEE